MSEKFNLNEEKISEFLQDTLSEMRTGISPEELNAYRKIFRKNVPFTMRSYFAAYLTSQIVSKGGVRRSSRVKSEKDGRKPSHSKVFLAPEVSSNLFISVGRKKRVFPKDIITLIMRNVEVPRENIGEIKILDNYSFVQVMGENAEEIISKLNNFYYRGKALSVSYAHTEGEREVMEQADS